MKDEIKEILDNIKIVIDEGHYRATCDIDYEDCKILYDYITNLQVENKFSKEYEKQYRIAKSRNEKAIRYMNNTFNITSMKEFYKHLDNIENILKGEDKDE